MSAGVRAVTWWGVAELVAKGNQDGGAGYAILLSGLLAGGVYAVVLGRKR